MVPFCIDGHIYIYIYHRVYLAGFCSLWVGSAPTRWHEFYYEDLASILFTGGLARQLYMYVYISPTYLKLLNDAIYRGTTIMDTNSQRLELQLQCWTGEVVSKTVKTKLYCVHHAVILERYHFWCLLWQHGECSTTDGRAGCSEWG